MTRFDKEMERGGLLFWFVVLLVAFGLYGFIFLTMALSSLLS